MPDASKPTTAAADRPPRAEDLLDRAERLMSQALHVGATRLIHESRHLREVNDRKAAAVDKLDRAPSHDKKSATGRK